MNYLKLANAFNTLEVAFHELKEAIFEQPEPVPSGVGSAGGGTPATGSPPATFEASPFEDVLEEVFPDQGSEAVCPAHHKPFIDGKFGPYCPNPGMDPAWTNKRGYCTVNPKNVATYLRVKAAA